MRIYITREEQAEIAGTLADLQPIHDSIQSLIDSPDSEITIRS